MSEKQPINYEQHKEPLEAGEASESKLSKVERAAAAKEQSEQLAQARAEVNEQSVEDSKTLDKLKSETETVRESYSQPINADLKRQTFQKEIKHIRRQLSKPDRALSKVIHQPAVKAISEVSSKTVTRPSGLLGGGLMAFIGSGAYLYFTRHIGLRYNYGLFFLLLVGGFVVGVVLEACFRLLARSHTAKS